MHVPMLNCPRLSGGHTSAFTVLGNTYSVAVTDILSQPDQLTLAFPCPIPKTLVQFQKPTKPLAISIARLKQ